MHDDVLINLVSLWVILHILINREWVGRLVHWTKHSNRKKSQTVDEKRLILNLLSNFRHSCLLLKKKLFKRMRIEGVLKKKWG